MSESTRDAPGEHARLDLRAVAGIAGPALLIPMMLFLVGPHTIFAANPGEFSVLFSAIAIPWLMAVVAVSWTLLTGIGCVLPGDWRRIYVAALFAGGLLVWAQGYLWVGDYGVLDGSETDFALQAWRVPYELGIGLAVVVIVIGFRHRLLSWAPLASWVFLGLQAATILFTSLTADVEQRIPQRDASPELYQFSSQHNVVHLVLDEFQSDVFFEIVEGDRAGAAESFEGFTYFVDHVSEFPTTALSMPAMLTGRRYRNEQPVPDFVRAVIAEGSLLKDVEEQGYVVDVVSMLPRALREWSTTDASSSGRDGARFTIRRPFVSWVDYRKFSARQLIELSVFRHAPHLLKVRLSASPEWFGGIFWRESEGSLASERRHDSSNSAAFLAHFTETMSVGRERPAYKLLHLGLPHRPIVVAGDCSFIGLTPISREVYLEQSRCAVRLVVDFLDRLRALGIYDSSLIIVSSDHGTSLTPRGFVGESVSLAKGRGPSTPGLESIAGMAKAVMLIKPPGSRGPLVISEAPTTQTDLRATVLGLLGISHNVAGLSMFSLQAGEARLRTHASYDVSQRFIEGYLERMDLLSIEHGTLDADGWSYERSMMPPDADLSTAVIEVGTEQASGHVGPGWSLPGASEAGASAEVSFAALSARQGVVFVSLPHEATELVARLSLTHGSGATIQVDVDGRVIGGWSPPESTEYRDYTIAIPESLTRPRVSTVTFRLVGESVQSSPDVRFERVSFLPSRPSR